MSKQVILLVDDNPDDVELTLRVLKNHRIANEVVVARDGVEALELLYGPGSSMAVPSLVLLDLKMPRLDGMDLLRRIRSETALSAITLSLGERPDEDLAAWREAGADRYLLRFETSDDELYKLIHPDLPGRRSDRMEILRTLQRLGYEAGSGIMVGIPGQTYSSVADDIDLFRGMDLDMIGIGPYISHPETPLGDQSWAREIPPEEQIPGDELTVYKVVALTRLVCPEANIPSTTALATINKVDGREQGLQRGANIVMPNLTPPEYRVKYEIYPDKACVNETAEMCRGCLQGRVESIGRVIGSGPGGRVRR